MASRRRHQPFVLDRLLRTEALIDRRRAQHLKRTGQEMSDGNMWLEQRLAEGRSLAAIIAVRQAVEEGQAVRGAGVAGSAHLAGRERTERRG